MAGQRESILITGGSGFIGACLARDLIADGHDVHLLLRPEFQHWRLEDIRGQFTPHMVDLRNAEGVKRMMDRIRPQVIYHLGTHGAYPFQKNRSEILTTNLMGTANLIDALESHDFKSFIHTGSSSEYGHKEGPMRVTDRLDPRSDYAVSKAAATHLCQMEAFRHRPFATVRVFAAYGPWEEPSRLVPYVMDSCARLQNPKVSAGQQPRDFIYVQDIVDLLKHVAATPSLRTGIWHAGTGIQSTVREMIETIVAVCGGGRVKAEFGAAINRPDEPTHWVADEECTRQATGWKPAYDLKAGVRAMWQWHCNRSAGERTFRKAA